MTRHLIIGMGEVGKSLYEVFKDKIVGFVATRDMDDAVEGDFDILHICYPWGKNFLQITKLYIEKYDPRIVIIHSTVPVGTTRKCGEICVHSPVRGRHPHLAEGLLKFVKFVGGVDTELVEETVKLFQQCGIRTYVCKNPETSEMAKLCCTTRYGWEIIFQKEMKKKIEFVNKILNMDIDFDEAYRIYNETYNEGYNEVGEQQFRRAIIADMPGKIGGHCVIPNCKILYGQFNWDIPRIIIRKNSAYQEFPKKLKEKKHGDTIL